MDFTLTSLIKLSYYILLSIDFNQLTWINLIKASYYILHMRNVS